MDGADHDLPQHFPGPMKDIVSPVDTAEQIAVEFAATAASSDASGRLPRRHIARLHETRLSALTAPKAFGGGGAGLLTAARVIGAIAHGDPSIALVLSMQYINLATLPQSRWPEALIARVLADAADSGGLINGLRVEPELGTPLRGGLPATIAKLESGGWRLSGHKIYSTGAGVLRWGSVWARTDEREPRVGAFLVPMSARGVRIEKTWNQLGMRATESHDVHFDDVLVPLENAADIRLPADWGQGRDAAASVWGALLIGAIYDGVARAAADWTRDFLRNRVPTSLGAPLSTLPRMQQAIGAIEEGLAVNRRLLWSAARDLDEGEAPSPEEANLLKVAATERAIDLVGACLKLTGNHGLARANPLERHYRNVLCGRIHSPQEDTAHLAAGRLALAPAP